MGNAFPGATLENSAAPDRHHKSRFPKTQLLVQLMLLILPMAPGKQNGLRARNRLLFTSGI